MKAEFYYDKRRYTCIFSQEDSLKELRIRNYQGLVLAVKQGQTIGFLGKKREDAIEVNVSQPRFYNLIKAATNALNLEEINQTLLDKDQLIKLVIVVFLILIVIVITLIEKSSYLFLVCLFLKPILCYIY
jgi:single-stranded-DNA-specific exonuclease